MNEEQVLNIIYLAIDRVNEDLGAEKIIKSEDSELYGLQGLLDSIGLVNLIVTVEEEIEADTGITLMLSDERAMSQKNSPFRSVRALKEYTCALLNEQIA